MPDRAIENGEGLIPCEGERSCDDAFTREVISIRCVVGNSHGVGDDSGCTSSAPLVSRLDREDVGLENVSHNTNIGRVCGESRERRQQRY